jgi:hypothetical protein
MRAKGGRGLSDSDRSGIRALAGSLAELAGPEEELEEAPPVTDYAAKARANRLALTMAEHNI